MYDKKEHEKGVRRLAELNGRKHGMNVMQMCFTGGVTFICVLFGSLWLALFNVALFLWANHERKQAKEDLRKIHAGEYDLPSE